MNRLSIKLQLLLVFLLLGGLSFITFLISDNLFNKKEEEILGISQNINQVQKLVLSDIKVTRDFLSNETINSDYFDSGLSPYLNQHKLISTAIDSLLYELRIEADKSENVALFDSISNKFKVYKESVNKIVSLINVRGFKDAALEGRMRNIAHELENHDKELGLANVLTLRKHEKDFIIRQSLIYKRKLHDHIDLMLSEIPHSENSVVLKSKLQEYKIKFDSIVDLDMMIGLKSQSGLKKEIDNYADALIVELNKAGKIMLAYSNTKINHIRLTFLAIWLGLILIAVSISLALSNTIIKDLKGLKNNISKFIDSDFNSKTIELKSPSANEISVLNSQFGILEHHIINQMRAYKVKNKELEIFIFRASRDVKTPLLPVIKSIKEQSDKTTDEKLKSELNNSLYTLESINLIIDELATVISLSRSELSLTEIDPSELLNRIILSLRGEEGFESIVFRKTIKMKEAFYSDVNCTSIILRNLIENSIRFRNHDSKTRFIDVIFEEIENKMVKIIIRDNGVGFDSDNINTFFDYTSLNHNGLSNKGVGLYIVQKVIEKLKGALKINSKINEGTEFIIYLPDASKKTNHAQRIVENQVVFPSRDELVLDYLH